MADTSNLTNFLGDIADAIRTKKETTEQISAANFDREILSIETGIDTSDANAVASDIEKDKTAYVNGEKVTGNLPVIDNYMAGIAGAEPTILNMQDTSGDNCIGFQATQGYKAILGQNATVGILAKNSKVANHIGLTPDKLVKGNTILDIEGTAETGGSGNIKLFETKEEMQADTTAQEGDLAIVYRNEIQNMTADMEVTSLTFPETVTLPTAFAGNARCMLRAVDSSVMFDGNCNLSQTSFGFDSWSESGMIRVNYTSTDGITYTRTRFQGDSGDLTNPVEIPACKVEMQEEWNDNLGYFMQIGGMYFEGLYQYANKINKDYYNIMTAMHVNSEELKVTTENENTYIPSLKNAISNITDSKYKIVTRENNEYYVYTIGSQGFSYASENKIYWIDTWVDSGGTITDQYKFSKYKLDLENSMHTFISEENDMFLCNWVDGSSWNRNYYGVILDLSELDIIAIFDYNNSVSDYGIRTLYEHTGEYMTGNHIDLDVTDMLYNHTPFKAYHYASTQFNLSNPNELLSGKIVYGKNGTVIGDGSIYDNLNLTELLDKPLNSTGFIDNTNARGNIPVLDNRILYYLKFTENGEYSIGNCTQNETNVNYLYKNKNIVVKCYLNYFTVHNGEELIYDFRTEEDYTDAFRVTPTTEVNHKITLTLRTGSQDGYNKDRIMQINLETGNVTTLCKRGDLVLEHCDTFSTNNGNSYGYLMDSRYAYLYISKYSSSAPYYVGTRLYLYDTMLDKSAEINFEAPVEQAYSGYGDILPYQTDKALYLKLNSVSHYNLYRMDKSTGEFTLFNERSDSYVLSDTYSYMAINSLIEDDNYFYYMQYGQIKQLSKTTMTIENTLTTNLPTIYYEYTLDNKLYYYDNYSTVHVFTINITETELTITEVDTVNVSDVDLDYIKNDCVITKPFSNITSDGSVNIKMYRCAETSINDYDLAVLGYNLGTNNNQKLHILQNNLYTTTISPVEYNTAVDTANEILK